MLYKEVEEELVIILKLKRDSFATQLLGVRNEATQLRAYETKYEEALAVVAGISNRYTLSVAQSIIAEHNQFKGIFKEFDLILEDFRVDFKDNIMSTDLDDAMDRIILKLSIITLPQVPYATANFITFKNQLDAILGV